MIKLMRGLVSIRAESRTVGWLSGTVSLRTVLDSARTDISHFITKFTRPLNNYLF